MINPDIQRCYLIPALLSDPDDAGRQGQRREREQHGKWREQAEAARRKRVLHDLAGQIHLRALPLTPFALFT
jgi:hypothetical protein